MLTTSECIKKTDQQLVALTLKNQKYYLCLMQRYEAKLLNYILKISSINKEDAEDILQEVFLKVYQNLNDYDSNSKFSSWIYRITHNATISAFRKKNIRPKSTPWDDEELDNILKSTSNIEKSFIQHTTYQQILNIIKRLPIKYKEILILKFIENKDYKEISDILHKPMGTVATLINRAKKMLNQELRGEGIIP